MLCLILDCILDDRDVVMLTISLVKSTFCVKKLVFSSSDDAMLLAWVVVVVPLVVPLAVSLLVA